MLLNIFGFIGLTLCSKLVWISSQIGCKSFWSLSKRIENEAAALTSPRMLFGQKRIIGLPGASSLSLYYLVTYGNSSSVILYTPRPIAPSRSLTSLPKYLYSVLINSLSARVVKYTKYASSLSRTAFVKFSALISSYGLRALSLFCCSALASSSCSFFYSEISSSSGFWSSLAKALMNLESSGILYVYDVYGIL